MRKTMILMAAGTALLATPALAQLVGGAVDATVGAGANLGQTAGDVTQSVTKPVGEVVDRTDGAVNGTLDNAKLTLATREQVRAGAQVSDAAGNSVGTVQSVDGDQAIVVDGGKLYNVPLSSLYSNAADAAGGLVTKLPKADIEARVAADAEAGR